MRFLIAIASKKYSEPTLRVGLDVAKAFQACVTIACVSPKPSSFAQDQIRLAQESMERWDFEQPAINVLEWAYNYLKEGQFIAEETLEKGFQKRLLSKRAGSRGSIVLPGQFCDRIELILRSGRIIESLRNEVRQNTYDVTIIGASRKRRMAHDLIQYIDSSILVVKQIDFSRPYRVLLAVDDSRGTLKAVKYGIQIAKAYGLEVDVLTVSKRQRFGAGYQGASDRACRYLENAGINYNRLMLVGDPVTVIDETAGDNHIIVMGDSSQNPIKKFFLGSKPQEVLETSVCPVLIVK